MYVGSAMIRFGADVGGLLAGVRLIGAALSALGAGNWSAAIGLGLAAIVVGLVSAATAAVQTASSFQQAMLKNAALAGLTGNAYTQFADQILALAPEVGQSPLSLAQGLYYVLSASIPASQALATLKYSAELAAIGMTDTQTVADAMTTVMKVFGVTAVYAANSMTVAVTSGKMQMADYAQAIGGVALAGKAAGWGLNTVNAALDVLTSHGFPSAAQASRNLAQLFIQMDQNVDNVAKRAKTLGLSFDEAKFKTMSFAEQIAYLNQVTHGNQASIKYLLNGSIFAQRAFNALTSGAKDYTAILARLNAAQQGAGAEAAAWAITQQGATFQWNRLTAAVQTLGVVFGNLLLPAVSTVLEVLANMTAGFAEYVASGQAASDITSFFSGVLALLSPIGQAFSADFGGVIGTVQNFGQTLRSVAGAVLHFFSSGIVGQTAMFLLRGAVSGVVAALHGIHSAISAATPFFTALMQVITGTGPVMISLEGHLLVLRPAVAGVAQIIADFVQKSRLIPLALSAGQAVIAAFGQGLRVLAGLFFLVAAPIAQMAQALYQFVLSGGFARTVTQLVGTGLAFLTALVSGAKTNFLTLVGALQQAALALHLPQIGAALLHGTLVALRAILLVLGGAFLLSVNAIHTITQALTNFVVSGRAAQTSSAALRATIGGIGSAFSLLGSILNGIRPVVQIIWDEFSALWGGIATGVVAVVLVAARLGILQHIGMGLRQVLLDLWQFLVQQFGAAWSSIVSSLSSAVSSFRQAWASIQDLMRALEPLVPIIRMVGIAFGVIAAIIVGAGILTALMVLNTLIMALARGLTFFIQGIAQVFQGVVQFISGVVQVVSGILTILVGIFTFNGATIQRGWNNLWSGVQNIIGGTATIIVGILQTFFGTLWGIVSGGIQGIIGFFTDLYNALVGHSIIPDLVNGVLRWFQNLISRGLSLIGSLVTSVLQWFLTMEMRVIATVNMMIFAALAEIQRLHDVAIQIVLNLVAQFITNLFNLKNQATTQIQNTVSSMTSILQGFVSTCFSIGSNIIHAIGSGIQSGLGFLGGVMQHVGGFIGQFLPHSPAKRGELMHLNEYGPALVRGFATGIWNSVGLLTPAMSRLAQVASLGGIGGALVASSAATTTRGGFSQADVSAIVAAVAEAQSASGGGGQTVLEVDGRQLARVVGPHLAKENRLTLGIRSGMLP